jgi:hypothetical protein
MESIINGITDIPRRDDGINGAMMYTEQISWILFLKFIDDQEIDKAEETGIRVATKMGVWRGGVSTAAVRPVVLPGPWRSLFRNRPPR